MLALLELALLAGVEGLDRAMVSHHAGVDGAFSSLRSILLEDLLVRFITFICHWNAMIAPVCNQCKSSKELPLPESFSQVGADDEYANLTHEGSR